VGGNIASTARIAVFQPGAPEVMVSVIYLQFDIFECFLGLICELYACGACPYTDYSQLSPLIQDLFSDAVPIKISAIIPIIFMRRI